MNTVTFHWRFISTIMCLLNFQAPILRDLRTVAVAANRKVFTFKKQKMKTFSSIILAFFLLNSATTIAQDARSKNFGPLMDGKGKSHDALIKQGWIYLFDSRIPSPSQTIKWSPMDLWRLRKLDAESSNCWSVIEEDGQRILKNVIPEGKHGTDLITLQEFRDFDLHMEVHAIANSGLYLRGRYEIQIMSNKPDETNLSAGMMGGIYSVSAPSVNASKGPIEWQTLDASIRGYKITLYLNGVLVQDNVEIPEGKKRIGTGTELGCWPSDGFSNDPETPGPILIQGNHGPIDVRNVRILTHPVVNK